MAKEPVLAPKVTTSWQPFPSPGEVSVPVEIEPEQVVVVEEPEVVAEEPEVE
jgi:hypothetical protein